MVTLPPRVVTTKFPKVIDPWEAFKTTFKAPVLDMIVLFIIIFPPPLAPVVPAFNVSVAALAPPLFKSAPFTVIVPGSVDPAIEVAVKSPPKVLAPRVRPLISVSSTLPAPLLFTLTAPRKLLFGSVKVIPNAPVAVNVAVPLTPCTMPPAACVIAPPAVIAIFLRLVTVVKVGTA